MFNLIEKIYKNRYFLLLSSIIVALTIFCISLGQTARWDILEHLQMADKYEQFQNFYSNPDDEFLTGSSVYFPGLSFLTLLFKYIFSDSYIIKSMQVFACVIIILFFFIQYTISQSYNNKITFSFFFYSACIFYIFFNYDWLIYAAELKPDALAFCMGAFGVIVSGINSNKKKSNFFFFFGIILTGGAIIFKQQHAFFLLGILFYSIFNKNYKALIFAFASSLIALIIIFFIFLNENSWFWTVSVIKDDGFISIESWISDHRKISLKYLIGFIAFSTFILFTEPVIIKNWKKELYHIFFRNSWSFILIFVFFGAALSSFKVGGNAGNTAFGLVVLMPIFLLLIKQLNYFILFIIFCFLIAFKIPKVIDVSLNQYKETKDLSNKFSQSFHGVNKKILIGSNLYYAVRDFRKSNKIVNYWMYSLKDNSDIFSQLQITNSKYKFDVLVVENLPNNLSYIMKSKDYIVFFKNRIGIIAYKK